MPSGRDLSASEAADLLGVSVDTLYAYVSRGLIRSAASSGGKRSRRYHWEDVQQLRERKELRRDPAKAVAQALHWGAPVLESAIGLIADGRLYYRGRDALQLAATSSIEEVAALIWGDDRSPTDTPSSDQAHVLATPHLAELLGRVAGMPVTVSLPALLALAEAANLAAYDLRPAAVARTGRRILSLLVAGVTGVPPAAGVAAALQAHWLPQSPTAARLLDAALILCADHELNASTFAARCVASTGATPYAAVIAGLAAASGPRHAGQTERIRVLLEHASGGVDAPTVVGGYLRRGERVPGFGHPLYPEGDPRARFLLNRIAETYPDSPYTTAVAAVADAASRTIGERPNVDYALVALTLALGLPSDAAFTLFVIGRSVGWIGHAIEQYGSDHVIRPRARYVGRLPHDNAQ